MTSEAPILDSQTMGDPESVKSTILYLLGSTIMLDLQAIIGTRMAPS